MKIVIVEDDITSAEFLETELKKINPQIEVMAVIDSVAEGIRFFSREHGAFLVFMDIELVDGISLNIFQHCEINCPVIFVTAFKDHINKAFDHNGIAYIEKPLMPEQLGRAMQKYAKLKRHMSADILDVIKNAGLPRNKRTVIIARKGLEFCFLRTENIAYFFSENYVVFAVDSGNKKFIVETTNLTDLMEELEETMFFKANRKFIVNINFIKKYKSVDRVKLQLEPTLPVTENIIIGQENAKVFKRWVNTL